MWVLRATGYKAGFAALVIAGWLAGCSTPPGDGPVIVRQTDAPSTPTETYEGRREAGSETTRYDKGEFLEPTHMSGVEPVRVGLLLPFSAPSEAAQRVASAMFDAAQLAAFEASDERFLLIPKDTRGDPEGAAVAARSALADGAEILLGPLFAESVVAAAEVARAAQIPMIAFSSDVESGGDGVYLLSFPPELEIERITDFAIMNGYSRFGLIAPATDYGERVSNAFVEEVFVRGGVIVHEERYLQDPSAMLEPAKRLAEFAQVVVPLELRHEYDPDAPVAPDADQGYVSGYQAVMMPESGTLLRALAPLLPYYDVDINQIKLLGVSGWNNPRLTREPALKGGWFAAPDPSVIEAFEARFAAVFGSKPPRLASLSYDATLLTTRLAQSSRRRDRFNEDAITDPNGYFGADGLFRLKRDGTVERGLAILEIQPGGLEVIDPAPLSFAPAF